ncbi:MAG: glycosyltransferase family 61 protein [Rickettsiales bacterium]|nr:glycosyltransferase family 61 protein [Rickettsiales bacterium]
MENSSAPFLIKNLRNAFVTNNSVIITQGKIVKDSCVRVENYQTYSRFKFRLKYFLPIFSWSKKTHILITDEWSKNYCHFLWEALSKLIELKKQFPDAILILPKSYLKIDFITKSLEAFSFKQDRLKIIPKRSKLLVKNLAFIPCINITTEGYYNFLKFSEIAQILTNHFQEKLKTNFGARIYISRSDPKKNTPRQVANEKELVLMLAKYGFKTVYMENFSFLEQISIMNNASFIIAPHGAGITNVMFARKNCHLVELVNFNWGKTCFAEMCQRMNINYQRFDCNPSEAISTLELGNIFVDITKLEKNLNQILK